MSQLRFRFLVATLMAVLVVGACAPRAKLAAPVQPEAPYTLGSGDRLRVTVFGQPNLTSIYAVDGGGLITMPLIGPVQAAGRTTFELKSSIESRLRNGYLREPNVSVEVETYRPFFILGEVQNAGQYPYVADMTAQQAVAIGGGYTPRAREDNVIITRRAADGREIRLIAPVTQRIRPGDVVTVRERWF